MLRGLAVGFYFSRRLVPSTGLLRTFAASRLNCWVQDAMASAIYNPVTGVDFDIIFPIGVLIRVVLVNSVLLPLAIFGIWLGRCLGLRRWQSQLQ